MANKGVTGIRWFAAFVVLASGLGVGVSPINAQTGSPEVEQVVDVIRSAYEEAGEALKKMPQDRFEPGPALESSDYEAKAIVEWVERNTKWVPYRGVLRGAEGVLLDRRGNSLDRSLLLASLLQDAGYEARLARGRLSAEIVDALLALPPSDADEAMEDEQLFPAEIVAAAARARTEAAALADLAGPLPENDSADTEAVADHWWVEAQLDSGWTALDPLLKGDLAAKSPEPVERLSPSSVPDSLVHKVTIRVVIERWDEGELAEEIPLEHTLLATDAVYQDLELLFVPYHFEPAPEGADAATEVRAVADTSQEWLPVLRRGSETIRQQGFDQEGNLERNPGRIAAARQAEKATSALQALGAVEEKESSHLTALWIEYQVDVPDRPARIVRREIFDLIGAASRREGAMDRMALDDLAIRERGRSLLGTHRVLITNAALPAIALEKAAWELWAKNGPQIAALVRLIDDPENDEVAARAYTEPLTGLDLLSLVTARHTLSAHRPSIFLATPNIFTTHFVVEFEKDFWVRQAFDVVVNDVGVSTGGSVAPARVRLEQGVLDTILEAAMLDPGARGWNTADLFASRGGKSEKWQKIKAQSPDFGLTETARARIADALDAGRVVVAPGSIESGLEPAWWEIDPVTGTTLGIGYKGWGTVAEETVRGIGTAGFMHNARRYSISVSCKVAFVYLKTNGWIFANLSGGLTYTVQAMEFLIRRGCSVVI